MKVKDTQEDFTGVGKEKGTVAIFQHVVFYKFKPKGKIKYFEIFVMKQQKHNFKIPFSSPPPHILLNSTILMFSVTELLCFFLKKNRVFIDLWSD